MICLVGVFEYPKNMRPKYTVLRTHVQNFSIGPKKKDQGIL